MQYTQRQRERRHVLQGVADAAVPFETPFAAVDGFEFEAADLERMSCFILMQSACARAQHTTICKPMAAMVT